MSVKANGKAGDRDIVGLVFSTLYLCPIRVNQTINNIPVLFTILCVIYYQELEFLMQKHNGNFQVILNPHILFVTPEFTVASNKCSCLLLICRSELLNMFRQENGFYLCRVLPSKTINSF